MALFKKQNSADSRWLEGLLRDQGIRAESLSSRPLGGGCVNEVRLVETGNESLVVKTGGADAAALFEAESRGLALLAQCPAIRVPTVISHGLHENRAYLLMEYIAMSGCGSQEVLGHAVAELHTIRGAHFGLDHDNFIGSTHQPNGSLPTWGAFFVKRRLQHQLALARRSGTVFHRADELVERLERNFPQTDCRPSLLHGDLWSGNVAFDTKGTPVLYDPACHYGDPESDLAMAELFGGFGHAFFEAHRATHPRSPHYASTLRPLYQLYHILNHHHLFGGYRQSAEALIETILAAL